MAVATMVIMVTPTLGEILTIMIATTDTRPATAITRVAVGVTEWVLTVPCHRGAEWG